MSKHHSPPPPPPTTPAADGNPGSSAAVPEPAARVLKLVSDTAVIIIGKRGCCMCPVVQKLLQGQAVNPPLFEFDDQHEAMVAAAVSGTVVGGGAKVVEFPAVFVGGKYFGGLERVMAAHISGELVPVLKQAGALWL
ncbi:glutaredoxin-C9-like [Arachis stenosperma]|uniref:glutaredoxin-C9-like n=1 Tax=Arachis stenosperma TaxID=217475 RepID=UPI0025AC63B5|nr:glutaredoxin-C9-like [Arachis stenosperma]